MNPRTTGILLLATAALGAFVWFYEIEGGEKRAEAEAEGKRLFPTVEQEAITEIELTTTDGSSARLERDDGSWKLVEPLAFPADVFAADGLASNLSGLASEAVLEDAEGPEEYGLGEGARVVRFRAGEPYALRLGNTTPIGSNSYAQVEGREDVVTVATFKKQSFEKALLDLRERRILDFDTNAVRRIEARWPGGEVQLERVSPDAAEGEGGEEGPADAGSAWRLTAPLDARGDDEGVDRLLQDLSFLRADGFVDSPPEDALARFAEPAYEIVLHGEAGEDGEAPSWRLAVGGVHEGDKRLVRAAQPSLYTIPVERLEDFPRRVVGYRFRKLANFRIGEASQVDFFFHPAEGDPVALTALRGEDGWASEGAERLAPGKVARIVSELAGLEAGDIVSESASEEELAALGLAPPNTIVSIFGEASEAEPEGEGDESPALPRIAEIHLGNVEGSEWILARAAGDPTVYRLGYELAEHVPVSVDALRNRFLAEEEPAAPAAEAPEGGGLEEFLTPSEESP